MEFLQYSILGTWETGDSAKKAQALGTGTWRQALGNLQLGNLAHAGNLSLTQVQENLCECNSIVSS